MHPLRPFKRLVALFCLALMAPVLHAIEIEAGPIWNNDDAQRKCPNVCSEHGDRTWEGDWRTLQSNVQSVCTCSGTDRDDRRDSRQRSSGATLSCSSDDGGRQHCDANTRDGVDLIRQRSHTACEQGYSWGFDERGVWVDHGCRADFAVGSGQGRDDGENNRRRTDDSRSDDSRRDYSNGADRHYPACKLGDPGVNLTSDGWVGPNCGKKPTHIDDRRDAPRPECELGAPGVHLTSDGWVGPGCGKHD